MNNNEPTWKTKISHTEPGKIIIRGYPIEEIIENLTFTETIFLTLQGRRAKTAERKMLDAIFSSCIDHSVASAAVVTTRTIYSGGNSLSTAVGGGVLSVGELYGGAIEAAGKLFSTALKKEMSISAAANKIYNQRIKENKRVPGYGHRLHKDGDPRVPPLLKKVKQLKFFGKYVKLALELEKIIQYKKGKKIPLNVDGLIAAIMLELGLDPIIGKGLFIISRVPGLIAHVQEEAREKPVRRISEGDYYYHGPAPKHIERTRKKKS